MPLALTVTVTVSATVSLTMNVYVPGLPAAVTAPASALPVSATLKSALVRPAIAPERSAVATSPGRGCIRYMAKSTAAIASRIHASVVVGPAAVARALEPLFGAWARIVFSIGIFAGAFSSFVVNAMVGGVIFSDGLGSGTAMNSRGVRGWTVIALLAGWFVASAAIMTGIDLVSFIIVAQALTVLAIPLLAAVIVWQLHALPRTPELRFRAHR